jgi:putative endonuclease
MTDLAFVYIVQCADDTLYTGWSNNVGRRIEKHNSKKGAKYTRSRTPVRLVYFHTCANKIEAMQLEYKIKQLTRAQKMALIAQARNALLPACLQSPDWPALSFPLLKDDSHPRSNTALSKE